MTVTPIRRLNFFLYLKMQFVFMKLGSLFFREEAYYKDNYASWINIIQKGTSLTNLELSMRVKQFFFSNVDLY
jgi:hypothetical protein